MSPTPVDLERQACPLTQPPQQHLLLLDSTHGEYIGCDCLAFLRTLLVTRSWGCGESLHPAWRSVLKLQVLGVDSFTILVGPWAWEGLSLISQVPQPDSSSG